MKQVFLSIFAALVMVNLSFATYGKAPSQGLDQECIQELEASMKYCKEVFMDKSYLMNLSPDCRRQMESNHYPEPETPCGKEMQAAGQAIMSKIMKCRNKHISLRCKEYIDAESKRQQENSKRCADELKRISAICGKGKEANEECYKIHRAELEAACGGQHR